MNIHIVVFFQTNELTFEMQLKTTDFKRNSLGRTSIYEYSPPPPQINALVSPLGVFILLIYLGILIIMVSFFLQNIPTIFND